MVLVAVATTLHVADAIGDSFETHGTLPVKLSKTFSLAFEYEPTHVAWSPDGSVLGVAGKSGTKLTTYDRSGHPLSEFQRSSNKSAEGYRFAFLNNSQVLFPLAARGETRLQG